MDTHLRVLRKRFLINTNMTVLEWFSNIFASLCFGQSSLSIGKAEAKAIFTLSCGYSFESNRCVLSDEYSCFRISVIFQFFCTILYIATSSIRVKVVNKVGLRI